jgi:hypothetical protein
MTLSTFTRMAGEEMGWFEHGSTIIVLAALMIAKMGRSF